MRNNIEQFEPFSHERQVAGLHAAIFDRTELGTNFQETLQGAISGVLAGLSDEKQADLYARIVDGGGAAGHRSFCAVLRYALDRTQLWGI